MVRDYQLCGNRETLADTFQASPWPTRDITWHLDTSGLAGIMDAGEALAAYVAAWQAWADVLDIAPRQVSNAAQALVRSQFGRIDGPFNVLAWSELADGSLTPKQQLFDNGETWAFSDTPPPNVIDLQRVACHEIGHVLGLSHDNQGADALLAPVYSTTIRYPRPRDILRLEMLGYKLRPIVAPAGSIPPTPPAPPVPPVHPPGGFPVDKTLLDQIINALFAALDTAAVGKPFVRLAIGFIKPIIRGFIENLMPKAQAMTLPGGLTKAAVKNVVDEIFALAETALAGDDWALMGVQFLHALAVKSLDLIVSDLKAQGLAFSE